MILKRNLRLTLLALLLLSAPSARGAESQDSILGRKMVDLEGQIHALGGISGSDPVALVFLGTACPISNRLIPELGSLSQEALKAGVELYGVISDPLITRAKCIQHAKEFNVAFPLLFDASGELAALFKPTHVP